jgi:phage-related minor tail protein
VALGIEVAVANIAIGPKLVDGFAEKLGSDLAKGIGPAAEKAGQEAGKKLSAAFEKAGKTLTKGVTAPILAIGTAAVAAGMDIDGALDTIRIKTGETGATLEQLNKDFETVAKTSTGSFERTGEVIADLNARLGLTGQPLQDLAKQLLDLEQITGEAANLDTLTRVLSAFGVPADEATATFDKLFRASQATGTNFNSLTNLLVTQSAAFAELGFNLDQTAALLGQFEKAGVNTETVLGGLRKNIVTAAKEGKSASQFFRDSVKQIEGFLAAGDDAAAQAAAKELFGARTFLDALDAIRRGQFNIDQVLAEVVTGQETISGLAETTADFPEKLAQLKKSLGLALLPIAETLIPAITDAVEAVLPVVEKLAAGFRSLSPETQKVIVVVGGLAAAIGPVLLVGAKVVGVVLQISKAVKALSLLLTANPWAIAAAAAIAAIVLIVRNWEPIKEFFAKLWQGIKDGAAAIIGPVVSFFSALGNGIVAIVNGVRNAFNATFGAIANVVRAAFNIISTIIRVAIDLQIQRIKLVLTVFTAVWDGIKRGAELAFGFVQSIVERVAGFITRLVDSVRNLPSTIASGIKGLGGGFLDAINPFRADGGPVSAGGTYIVGERGPEVFVPRTSGTIIPNNQLSMGGGGDTYNITVVNPVAEPTSTSLPGALRRASYLRG